MRYILLVFTVIFPLTVCAQGASPNALTCSPAPCILPNVQASEGGLPVKTSVMAVNPSNSSQLLIGTEDNNCTNNEGVAVSGDGGTTWKQTCLPSNLYMGAGDPIVAYDLNGVAYAGGLYDDFGDPPWGISLSSSNDNGKTWGSPVTAMSNTLGYFAWQPWLTVDTNPTSPNKNTLYVSATQQGTPLNSQIWISHSTDGGKTWTAVPVDNLQISPKYDAFSVPAVGPNGTVYLSWLRCLENSSPDCTLATSKILFSRSSDGGSTWTGARVIATATLMGDPG